MHPEKILARGRGEGIMVAGWPLVMKLHAERHAQIATKLNHNFIVYVH